MVAAPTGEVTLVFTDMDGSGVRWEDDLHGAHRRQALHDAAVRQVMARHDGYEVKATGDGFLVAFAAPEAAVRFSLETREALALIGLTVRVGAHRGTPLCLQDPRTGRVDYYGPPANKAARLRDAAHLGQIVFSDAARAGAGPWVSLGEHALRGIEGRHALWQLGAGEHARLRTVELRQTNLPARPDAFIGREDELKGLLDLLTKGERLVTLLGPGGAGKTRLSQQVAWELLGEPFLGVWFCDLSEARTLDEVVSAVAGALDLPPGRDMVRATGWAIAGRGRTLIVLDNFEQVVEHAAATVAVWVGMAPEAVFLATSRIPLRLRGERVFEISSLRPEDGLKLLVDRGFGVDPADPCALTLISRLDGLALAIELAAARTRSMSVSEVTRRLDRRFRLLAGGSADLPHRHRALKAALDWSWDLMSADERKALAQLSVFDGGFCLEAAEAVLEVDGWALDVVQGLVEHSLLQRDRAEDRYGMLSSVSEYAAEKLDALGGRTEAEERHRRYYAARWDEAALRTLRSGRDGVGRRKLRQEAENLVHACRRSIRARDVASAVATLLAVVEVIDVVGPFSLGIALCDDVLALPGIDPTRLHRIALRSWQIYQLGGASEAAQVRLEAALEAGRGGGDAPTVAAAAHALGELHLKQGRQEEAAVLLTEALDRARAHGDGLHTAMALRELGSLAEKQGRYDDARELYLGALALFEELGERRHMGATLNNLGLIDREHGRLDEAERRFHDALAVHRELGNRRSEAIALGNLGVLNVQRGRLEAARSTLEQALEGHRAVGNRAFVGITLGNLGMIHHSEGRPEAAHAEYEAALSVHRELENRKSEGVILCNQGELFLATGAPEQAEQRLRTALDLHRAIGNRRFEAIALALLGDARRDQGAFAEATEASVAALQMGSELGDRAVEALASRSLALTLTRSGRHGEALELAHRAAEIGPPEVDPVDQALALAALIEVCLAAGHQHAAAHELERLRAGVSAGWRVAREIARLDDLLTRAASSTVIYMH